MTQNECTFRLSISLPKLWVFIQHQVNSGTIKKACLSKYDLIMKNMFFSLGKKSFFTTYQKLKTQHMCYMLEESLELSFFLLWTVYEALFYLGHLNLSVGWWLLQINYKTHSIITPLLTDPPTAHLQPSFTKQTAPHVAVKILLYHTLRLSKCCWYFSHSLRALLYL